MSNERLEGIAYSYIRFSAKEQEKGDSVRRQTQLRDDWLKRHPLVELDTSLTLQDLGKSAFTGAHRTNPDRNALASFLKLVGQERIPKGSFLIVESLDRLTREHVQPALLLLLELLRDGVRVVQLSPTEAVFDEKSDMMPLMMAIMELSRGNSESRMKSERVGAAWTEKKRQAAESGKVLTRQCPAWLEVVGDKFQFRAGAKEVIERIFAQCIAGYGGRAIVKELNDEKVSCLGKGQKWEEAYVRLILTGRAVVGEFQPMKGSKGQRTPDGPPIPNYFPAAVDEKTWDAAKTARDLRDKRGGRPAKEAAHVNVFQGLLRDARDGGTVQIGGRMDRGRPYRILVPSSYKRHGGTCYTFPLNVFERAVLSRLSEIDSREITAEQNDDGRRLLELKGQLARVEESISAITAEMDANGESPALFKRLRDKEAAQKELVKLLAEARQKAANPMSETWDDARSLLIALADADDLRDARVRLQAALRRSIDSIWVLMSSRGNTRLATVQVWFAGCEHFRIYRIMHRPPHPTGKKLRPGQYWVTSVAFPASEYVIDLRKPDSAERELERLKEYDPSARDELDRNTTTGFVLSLHRQKSGT